MAVFDIYDATHGLGFNMSPQAAGGIWAYDGFYGITVDEVTYGDGVNTPMVLLNVSGAGPISQIAFDYVPLNPDVPGYMIVTDLVALDSVGVSLLVVTGMTAYVNTADLYAGEALAFINTSGDDTIRGDYFVDYITGGPGNDLIEGWADDDVLSGDAGNDTIDGGGEHDWMDGGSGNDLLKGGNGDDDLYGYSGNDNLSGGNGIDWLFGEAGKDTLAGGSGNDKFFFTAISNSGASTGTADYISDFKHGYDDIDLSGIDANASTGANDKFAFVATRGTATSAVAKGKVGWYQVNASGTANDFTYIRVNNDSDTGVDMTIKLKGLVTLTAGDFIL